MDGPLVSTGWLRGHLEDPGLRVVDCRYRLGEPGAGEAMWREGHIPGAAFLDVDRDLAGEPGERGRHPLPDQGAFEQAARRAEIGRGARVVAYDEAGEGGAARLWWLLRHFGHGQSGRSTSGRAGRLAHDVAVLDGGLRAWRDEGGALARGDERPAPGDFEARPRDDDAVTRDDLAEGDRFLLLLDARAPERYQGEVEPIDPVAGHIPGAVNVPFAELAPDGRFLPRQELRRRLETAGVTGDGEVVAYCGSGVTACVLVLAAEVAGAGPARLYPGSWSEWLRARH